jgi:hypothetical protein
VTVEERRHCALEEALTSRRAGSDILHTPSYDIGSWKVNIELIHRARL